MILPLKAARKQRQQTLKRVANAVGTDAGNLSRIENGKQRASPDLAEKLAAHFGHAVSEIQILYPMRFMAVEGLGLDDETQAKNKLPDS